MATFIPLSCGILAIYLYLPSGKQEKDRKGNNLSDIPTWVDSQDMYTTVFTITKTSVWRLPHWIAGRYLHSRHWGWLVCEDLWSILGSFHLQWMGLCPLCHEIDLPIHLSDSGALGNSSGVEPQTFIATIIGQLLIYWCIDFYINRNALSMQTKLCPIEIMLLECAPHLDLALGEKNYRYSYTSRRGEHRASGCSICLPRTV